MSVQWYINKKNTGTKFEENRQNGYEKGVSWIFKKFCY